MQHSLLPRTRPKGQLLKWVGNKYKYAHTITAYFPDDYNHYLEPFLGIGAVLATVAPTRGIAGDVITPLVEFWKLVQRAPESLISYYRDTITRFNENRQQVYDDVKTRYNAHPNPFDMMVISRTCYGGVMRFTREGRISTPIGPHKPIAPETFEARLHEWRERVKHTKFVNQSFSKTMQSAGEGDLIYCDPPYIDTQSILYGAQDFSFSKLVEMIAVCKARGAKIALSIDGTKKSGTKRIAVEWPKGLFEREVLLDCGSSMLRRFQNGGSSMIGEDVHDRLLLTW
ncbi:MAG TPA: Dam family site-specific DNA-(adenine-N6)-methyltransferase [Acidobacteriota bacterium]|nr:Dam family site-specific DNA-(adenine-N6)-methyltransferase [Acidobacteriota bacterium]